jgi:hypothetical protein
VSTNRFVFEEELCAPLDCPRELIGEDNCFLLARFVFAKPRKSFLLARFMLVKTKKASVARMFLRILCARQILLKVRFGNRVCEQNEMTFEVTDASSAAATC